MKRNLFFLFLILTFNVEAVHVAASTIRVPTMASTIQAAVSVAVSGDTVLLAAGTYTGADNRDISLQGKQLVITSESGSGATTIDVQNQPVAAFHLDENESTGVQFSGITIRHARSGLFLDDAYPELHNMRFVDNQIGINFIRSNPVDSLVRLTADSVDFLYNDTGIYILSGSPQPGSVASLSGCTFSSNGKGLAYYSGDPDTSRHVDMTDCLFRNNNTGITSSDFVYYQELVCNNCSFDSNATAIINSITLTNSTVIGGQYGIKGFLSSRDVVSNTHFEQITNTVLRTNAFAPSSQSSSPPNFDPGFILTDCSISNNPGEIASLGGFINEDPVGASFTNCQFTHNGGGITGMEGLHRVTLEDCLYANNGDGIDMRASGNGLTITGCTFANNTGTAVDSWLDDWSVTITQSIFYGQSGSGVKFSHFDPHSQWSISCSDFFSNAGGDCVGIPQQTGQNGNIAGDPLFCNSSAGVYSLYQQSPCVASNDSCAVLIGALEAACTTPIISFLTVDTATDNQHVVAQMPVIFWSVTDSLTGVQTAAEVEVGSDTDWSSAELWSPPSFVTVDTFVSYTGASLTDGQTYYLRVRVQHNSVWSEWSETAFRMNSAPSIPVPLFPSGVSVPTAMPVLRVLNASDAENDSLQYQFAVYSDSALTMFAANSSVAASGMDTTAWVVTTSLEENGQYWWRARANDGHESSDWSPSESFWVNMTAETPASPATIFPPTAPGQPLYEMKPTFRWQEVVDPDPYDTIHYAFELTTDSTFATELFADSLTDSQYVLPDSLLFNTEYWWRVRSFDQEGLHSTPVSPTPFHTWTLGDVNQDDTVNIGDVVVLAVYLFRNGPSFGPSFVDDLNSSCTVNILDLTYLVGYLFRSGEPPNIGCQ